MLLDEPEEFELYQPVNSYVSAYSSGTETVISVPEVWGRAVPGSKREGASISSPFLSLKTRVTDSDAVLPEPEVEPEPELEPDPEPEPL